MKARVAKDILLIGHSFIYLAALVSLYWQIPGMKYLSFCGLDSEFHGCRFIPESVEFIKRLYGEKGLVPVASKLSCDRLSCRSFRNGINILPLVTNFFCIAPSYALQVIVLFGIALDSISIMSELARNAITYLVLFIIYSTAIQVGDVFLWFQWDTLLIESGAICILIAPLPFVGSSPADNVSLYLMRWLLFRLMYSSGVVKLTSHCPLWWDLAATKGMFPRFQRLVTYLGTAMSAVLITSTLYFFIRCFNIGIDGFKIVSSIAFSKQQFEEFVEESTVWLLYIGVIGFTTEVIAATVRMTGLYGRPEVIVEGSYEPNGPWIMFEFYSKPGRLDERPRFVLPHQPRLDWQMWFAALGSYQNNPFFLSLIYHLLRNNSEVTYLMKKYPFEAKLPNFIRANLYLYHYTNFNEKSGWTKDYWRRDFQEEYMPSVTREDTGLSNYLHRNGFVLEEQFRLQNQDFALESKLQTLHNFVRTLNPTTFVDSVILAHAVLFIVYMKFKQLTFVTVQ
uniref:Lipase maturation factor n=1 Tax=Setaria digitata TaxID=48799 RepID=A0A915PR74_9BILA